MTLRKVQAEQLDLTSPNSEEFTTGGAEDLSLTDKLVISDVSDGDKGKVATLQQVVALVGDNLTGALSYQGVWDAGTNTITPGGGNRPAASLGNKGWYYIVTVAGSGYSIGDWTVSNGVSWDKVDNTDSVASVNGYTGAVVLTNTDVGAAATSHIHDWSDITSGTPTTLAGYGITDATPSSHVGSGGAAHADAVPAGASGFMTGADKTKLDGVAIGATANQSDAYLLSRANHTGTQLATTISDFSETVDDRVSNLLTEGDNIDYIYNDAGNSFSIAVNPNPVWTGTSHERMVIGTTAERPVSPVNGDTRFNSTLSREEIYKGAWTPFGRVLQVVAGDIAVTTITATTPAFGSTAPATTDGTAIWSTSFTPLKSTSKILIMFNVWHANSNNARTHTGIVNYGGAVLSSFVDGTENSTRPSTIGYFKQHLPGNTTTVTVEARMGTPGGNTLYVNQGSTQTMGGTGITSFIILEIEA